MEKLNEKIRNYWELEPEVIQYSLRDPILYGDFRNACNEEELRFYEDLLDYEAVYSLFLEVKLVLLLYIFSIILLCYINIRSTMLFKQYRYLIKTLKNICLRNVYSI